MSATSKTERPYWLSYPKKPNKNKGKARRGGWGKKKRGYLKHTPCQCSRR